MAAWGRAEPARAASCAVRVPTAPSAHVASRVKSGREETMFGRRSFLVAALGVAAASSQAVAADRDRDRAADRDGARVAMGRRVENLAFKDIRFLPRSLDDFGSK